MLRRMIMRLAVGFGSTVFVVLAIQLCLLMTGGRVVTPAFAARFPGETAAVLAQLGLAGVIGMSFAGAAQIFEIERWSFLVQGAVHFLVTAAVWMPIAWLCWTPIPEGAIMSAAAGWLGTYAATWLAQYFVWRRKVRMLNLSIRAAQEERENAGDRD